MATSKTFSTIVVISALCTSFANSAVVQNAVSDSEVGKYVASKNINFQDLGDGEYSYTRMKFLSFWDFDFASAHDCTCDCDAEAGDVYGKEEDQKRALPYFPSQKRAITKTEAVTLWSKQRGRPLVTTVRDALNRLQDSPDKRVTFINEILRRVENDSSKICECCQNIFADGGMYDYIDD